MYALVSLWQLSQAQPGDPPPQIDPDIGPFIWQWPGFVEDYWTYERANGKLISFALLETADHARDLKNSIESHMEAQDDPSLQLEMIRVLELVAHAPASGEGGRLASEETVFQAR